ncbi:NPCBM/NEW2 domain-containing protein [Saccharothrix deserti]|uniref:NPCBM/NEW2 domain-containing protein n=1 Tax=Saccharothrix deserti TaxID=2593674 RepID=UPI001EE3E233|nr:NPCBM/NEW2 domain-containing protein [Saccharothrix deserti]
MHAESYVDIYLGGRCTSFTAEIGVDDEVGPSGSVEFEVSADGVSRYVSPTLTGDDDAVPIAVDVAGAKVLRLKVAVGANGNAHDHADWAAATVHCGS